MPTALSTGVGPKSLGSSRATGRAQILYEIQTYGPARKSLIFQRYGSYLRHLTLGMGGFSISGKMEQLAKPKFESWREAERVMKATRDKDMKVSLPRVRCLESVGAAPLYELEDEDVG